MSTKKISVITLGCKTNQYESDVIKNLLQKEGFLVNSGLGMSDYYILNTCAVTNEAEKKSRTYIAKIKKLNKNAKIFVCGCASQNNPSNFLKRENIISVLGTYKKTELVDAIKTAALEDVKIVKDKNLQQVNPLKIVESKEKHIEKSNKIKSENSNQMGHVSCPANEYENMFLESTSKTRAIIKIQDGCNNFCSYCIIPYLRGRERSRKLEAIQIEIQAQSKYAKEIIFTGINTSAWGKDFNPKMSLVGLIKLCNNFPKIRFRFSSLEMNIIDDNFLDEMLKCNNISRHFHLSLQSANNNVLKAMNRKYNIEEYKEKINLIRKYFPLAAITTDIIVGFPTESDVDFEDTYKNIKEIAFSDIHIFPFSKREGTLASQYKELNGNIIVERKQRLEELRQHLHTKFLTQNIGKTYTILTEKSKCGYQNGLTSNYIRCYFKHATCHANKLINVKLISLFKDGVLCEICDIKECEDDN